MSIDRRVILLTIAFHRPEDISDQTLTHHLGTWMNRTHLRSRTATPAFFKARPSVFHRASHVSSDIFVSEPRPIALRKLSGVAISPTNENEVEISHPKGDTHTSWWRNRFKESTIPKYARKRRN
jgi:hypothetical protein